MRLMVETGARAGEVLLLEVPDVDLGTGTAIVRRGKGGNGRSVPFRPRTGRRSTAMSGCAERTASPGRTPCGSATGARASATRPCTPR
jgi:site-specific recombinase XerC